MLFNGLKPYVSNTNLRENLPVLNDVRYVQINAFWKLCSPQCFNPADRGLLLVMTSHDPLALIGPGRLLKGQRDGGQDTAPLMVRPRGAPDG